MQVRSIFESLAGLDDSPTIVALADEIGARIDRAAFDPEAREDGNPEGRCPRPGCGAADGVVERYAESCNAINPWRPVMLSGPAMQPIFSERLLPASEFARTDVQTDWLSQAGGADASSGMRFAESGGRLVIISLQSDLRRAESTDAVYEPLLRVLGPCIRRTLDASRHAGSGRLTAPSSTPSSNRRF